jgi:hypothetical protein
MKRDDWILVFAWLIYIAALGPFLISARDNLRVASGLMILVALLYFTQRRLIPLIKEKFK